MKSILIKRISGMEDSGLLSTFIEMSEPDSEEIYNQKLSPEQIAELEIRMEEVANGKFVTNEELIEEEEKWLNE